MPNFTPGPWNIHRAYPLDTAVRTTTPDAHCPEPFDYWSGIIAQGETILAEVCMQTSQNGGWPHVEDLEEARANAVLISAAPEMYEALKEALAILESIEAKTLVGHEGCIWPAEIVRAALAKADGREAR